jgi:hypothetical protein
MDAIQIAGTERSIAPKVYGGALPPGDIAPPFSTPHSPCNLSAAEDFDLSAAIQQLAPIARPKQLHLSI